MNYAAPVALAKMSALFEKQCAEGQHSAQGYVLASSARYKSAQTVCIFLALENSRAYNEHA